MFRAVHGGHLKAGPGTVGIQNGLRTALLQLPRTLVRNFLRMSFYINSSPEPRMYPSAQDSGARILCARVTLQPGVVEAGEA